MPTLPRSRLPGLRLRFPKALSRFADWRVSGALASLLIGSVIPISSQLQDLDWMVQDAQMQVAARLRESRAASDMVLVVLDDDTLAGIPEPLALLHPHLGEALEALAGAGARAVGVDLVLPSRSFDAIVPGYDAKLVRGILAMRRVGPVVLARTVDDAGQPREILQGFVSAAGDMGTGFALLPVDEDGVVRRYDERLGEDGARLPTLVGTLASRLGTEPQDGLLDFSRRVMWRVVPMGKVLAWAHGGERTRLAQAFQGKVVLIGSTLNLVDLHRVPVASDGRPGLTSGVFVHAQALHDLRSQSLIQEVPGWVAAALGALCGLGWYAAMTWRRTLLTVVSEGMALLALASGLLLSGWVLPLGSLLCVVLAVASLRLLGESMVELAKRRHLRRVFAGYVSPGVLTELESGRLKGLDSARCFICVLFVDIRGFTSRSESDAPERVTTTLNSLFASATEVIHRHGGTVKEFMGDGVMAFFGAPVEMGDPVRAGFDAGRDILASLPEVNRSLERMGLASLSIGMGLACGEAVVGHIGAANRHTYGAVGDCVNLASRLEGLSAELGYPLLLSAGAAARLETERGIRRLGAHPIKGHSPVEIHAWAPAS